jgi:GxxExxY protein
LPQFPPTHDRQTYAIIGAAMAVHRELGPGFLEAVYQEALSVEFFIRGIDNRREVAMPVRYRGCDLACRYRVDFVCFDAVLVEIEAQHSLAHVEEAQVLNYLKASGFARALLLNFGQESLVCRRFIHSR